MWPYVRPVRVRVFGAALVAALASCTGLVIPLVLKWLVDGPVADRDTAGVWAGGALLLGVGLLEAGLFAVRRWLSARPLAGVEAAMRADFYRHLQRLPVSFHDRWPSGQLLSRATTDLELLRRFLSFGVTFLLVNVVTVVVGCVILLSQRWTLGLVVLGPFVPLVWLCTVFEHRYSRAARRAQDQIGDLTTLVEEAVLGIRVIKGFGRHRSQALAFRALSGRLLGTELDKARLLARIWAVIMLLPELAVGAALVLGAMQVAEGALSAGTLVAFLSTALALRWPVETTGFLLALSNESATATDRFFEVLDEPLPRDVLRDAHEAREAHGATDVDGGLRKGQAAATAGEPTTGDRAADGPDGLRFSSVVFRYADAPDWDPPVLDGVDLHVRHGETMALVGATGSGKTTLTALVPRLHEVTAGHITLDGEDIGAMRRAELRSRVAVAFEEPTLFSASVAENVLMGADGELDAEPYGTLGAGPGATPGLAPDTAPDAEGNAAPDAEGNAAPDADRDAAPDADRGVEPDSVPYAEVPALVPASASASTPGSVSTPGSTTDSASTPGFTSASTPNSASTPGSTPGSVSRAVPGPLPEPRAAAADGPGPQAGLDRALRVSQAHEFVAALPQGPRTQVGEQGLSLSGGQRQRLALARAVVGRPPFLVLDDPLSALDVHTEAAVEAALREVLTSTTALVVAHRPSTVLLADRVALLSGGRITAVGTHHELLRGSAEYRRLMSGDGDRQTGVGS
ncbi:ATP-binding cassette domain-containing protein [Streptomyces sp. HNM0575]|uniref:ABC transporter ATP-binding protein n=1 Tax=Streptomyces sp. HNM0575 TaxID=2716338 RepID=UPI00145D2271|nr:ABC transporter ATP-binding protein [Streptomyces sp. HNM0575]NLU74906.1 ATP-binding cassette domain-containing protein [Streptomyces sp. HNM0575]